jgi:hypothetical protein
MPQPMQYQQPMVYPQGAGAPGYGVVMMPPGTVVMPQPQSPYAYQPQPYVPKDPNRYNNVVRNHIPPSYPGRLIIELKRGAQSEVGPAMTLNVNDYMALQQAGISKEEIDRVIQVR